MRRRVDLSEQSAAPAGDAARAGGITDIIDEEEHMAITPLSLETLGNIGMAALALLLRQEYDRTLIDIVWKPRPFARMLK